MSFLVVLSQLCHWGLAVLSHSFRHKNLNGMLLIVVLIVSFTWFAAVKFSSCSSCSSSLNKVKAYIANIFFAEFHILFIYLGFRCQYVYALDLGELWVFYLIHKRTDV